MIETLRNRWRIAAALFVLTLIATVFAFASFPWTYQASANVLLVPSKVSAKSFGGNPYLAFTYTLDQTANVLTFQSQDAATVQELANAGYTSSYTVAGAPGASAPVIVVTVTGSSKNAVERTLGGVTQKIGSLLAADQPGVDAANQITAKNVTFALTPTRLSNKKARPLIVVFGLGVLLTFAVPSILESSAVRRRSLRSSGKATKATKAREDDVSHDGGSGRDRADYQGSDYQADDYPRQPQYPDRAPYQDRDPRVQRPPAGAERHPNSRV